MNFEALKDYVPLIVAVTSAILAYLFGKSNENDKHNAYLNSESMDLYITKMYKEVLNITNVSNYNVKKIKKFIVKYSNEININKVVEEELIYSLYDLSIKIRKNEISNLDLKKYFETISLKIEQQYWNRLKVSSNEFNWWLFKKVSNRWRSIPTIIINLFKDFFEILCILLVIFSFIALADQFGNGDFGLLPAEIRGILYQLTVMVTILYIGFFILNYLISVGVVFNRKNLVKKL